MLAHPQRERSRLVVSTGRKQAEIFGNRVEVGRKRMGRKRIARWYSGLFVELCHFWKSGAGEGIRTLDPDLGKVVLYP
jgi:hypothetical protein